ncbi:anthranilate phosphoribosyltransferase [Oscillochloris trichoides DG-6]|uniref:Anthranilate phosphoribosyltransferase n=1 Tax=Oscillochloris trichoides DG-6 TaxID=765420 RepID=E1IBQ1_9CHLR|nr:anthranilate phosphoribosyltransferase [Oscillochloris trichoides]EFO81470.1 anthranilate phosphoribosyltransferase [Oscillochloris trichoides DG-6]
MNIRDAIITVVGGKDLSQAEAAMVMEEIMTGVATPAQIGAFLTALHLKGETDAEIAGMAEVMRAKATHVYVDGPVADTCGTGGDGAHTFNISTAAAFVAAGAGLTVAKHGNRAMSSICGSADVLEGLGVRIDLEAEGVARCLSQAKIGFMFAPNFHPAMRFAGPVRREIGIRTIFNILGPLTNPARARHQVLGVASAPLAEKLARALSRLDTVHALVVHGHGGVDELTLSGPNLIYDVRGGHEPTLQTVAPEDLGLARAHQSTLRGGDVATNAAMVRAILAGEEQGPPRDVVLLNAAAALVAGDLAQDLGEGLAQARTSIDQGHAMQRLEAMVAVSNQ